MVDEQNNRPQAGGPGGERPAGGGFGDRPVGGGGRFGERPAGGGGRFGDRPAGGGGRFGDRPGGDRPGGDRPGGGRRFGGGGGGRFFPRRKIDQFAADQVVPDYKDVQRLRRMVSDRAKIEPRRKTGTSAKNQRAVTVAIKRARHMALLPFTSSQGR